MMAEDEAAENNLLDAIKRVHGMPWPTVRQKVLWRAFNIIAGLLDYEVVQVERPKAVSDSGKPNPS